MSERYTQHNPSPLKCDTTGTNVDPRFVLNGQTRITRGKMHRLLKSYGISHHHDATLEQLIHQAQIAGIQIEDVPPGPLRDMRPNLPQARREEAAVPKSKPKKVSKALEYAEDGFPKLVPVLRKMLKERGIKTQPTLKRPEAVKLMQDYLASLNGDGDGENAA